MRFQCILCFTIIRLDEIIESRTISCPNCNKMVAVPKSGLEKGCVINDFVIEGEIGRGGMATVYAARQLSLDRTVALKVLAERYAQQPTFEQRFLKEAKSAARLNHANIIQALAVGRDDNRLFYAMEYVKGATLGDVIEKEERLEIDEALNVVQQAAEGLHTAWTEEGLIHRDMKPDNIMLSDDGRAQIMDLGIAVHVNEAATAEISGTPKFMAPEQFVGNQLDCRADIYSLGATLFNAIVGYPPFTGGSVQDIARKHMHSSVEIPSDEIIFIPNRIKQLILRMMAKEPSDRFPDYDELLEEIVTIRQRLAPDAALVPSVHTVSFSKYRLRDDQQEGLDEVVRRRRRNKEQVAIAKHEARQREVKTNNVQPAISRNQLYVLSILAIITCALLAVVVKTYDSAPSEFARQAQQYVSGAETAQLTSELIAAGDAIANAFPSRSTSSDRRARLELERTLLALRNRQLADERAQLAMATAALRVSEQAFANEQRAWMLKEQERAELATRTEAELVETTEAATERIRALSQEEEALTAELERLADQKAVLMADIRYRQQLQINGLVRNGKVNVANKMIERIDATGPIETQWKQSKLRELAAAERMLALFASQADKFVGQPLANREIARVDGDEIVLDDGEVILLAMVSADDILRLCRPHWSPEHTFSVTAYRFAISWGDFQYALANRPTSTESDELDAVIRGCFQVQMRDARRAALMGGRQAMLDDQRQFKNRYSREQRSQLRRVLYRKSSTTGHSQAGRDRNTAAANGDTSNAE